MEIWYHAITMSMFKKLPKLNDGKHFVTDTKDKVYLEMQHNWMRDIGFARILSGNHSMDINVYALEQNNGVVRSSLIGNFY